MWRAAWLVFLNEFHLLARDRVGMLMLIVAPVVIILVAGLSLGNLYGARPGPGAYVLPLVDDDRGAAARALVSALEHQSSLRLLKLDTVASARQVVERQERTPVALIIPAGTTRILESGREAQLVLYVDPAKRLELTAIELQLDQLCRRITAQVQAAARRKLAQQGTALRQQVVEIANQMKQVQTAAGQYRRRLIRRRTGAEALLNAQVQRAVGDLKEQTAAAIERSRLEASSALTRQMASRRDALLAVRRYLSALETTEHQFDDWLATLRRLAGSHQSEVPPPPTFPIPPSKEQLSELLKPFSVPVPTMPSMPALPRFKLPDLPPPPRFAEPAAIHWPMSLNPPDFPGYLDWRERPVAGGNPEPNAFDQYVPGFGITFLLIAMLMAIGMGLIDERDWGTLQRLRVSGAPLQGVLAGKLCARFLTGLFQMIVLFTIGWALFGISLGRSPAMLLVPTAAISFAAASFSLVIACVARTHDSVMPIGAVAAMAMAAIGGCWWPLDFEPAWMRAFAQLLPTTWTMQAYNGLMLRDAPAAAALSPSACAAALGFLYLIVGMVAAGKRYR